MSFLTKWSLVFVMARFGLALPSLCAPIVLLALVASRALPGGGAIGFLSFRDDNVDIYVLDIARGTLHNLTDNGADNGSFAFSPDGTRIAFESNKDGNTEIYMMNVECPDLLTSCGGITQLTDAETDSHNPVWSPDGRQIAYVYDVSWEDADNEIYVMDVESRATRNLTNHAGVDNSPAWSLDGIHIAFVSERDSILETLFTSEIYVVDTDGSNLRRLTHNDTADVNPAWSPDGTQIAFICTPDGNEEICLISPDESRIRQLTTQPSFETNPIWSPNGREIIFTSYGGGVSNLNKIEISGGETQLFSSSYANFPMTPSWLPNGTWIAFQSYGEVINQRSIYLIDDNGGNSRRLTDWSYDALWPNWWP